MSYRLEDEEDLPGGVRRIVREQIDRSLAALANAEGDDLDEAVHESRRCFKRIRGALRLVRNALGKSVWRRENRTFRDFGKRLAGVRDAYVMQETLARLKARFPDDLPRDYTDRLEADLVREHQAGRDGLVQHEAMAAAVVEGLREARARVDDWPLERDTFDAIAPGLHRIYRQAGKALHAARDNGDAEDFHDLRKRTKDHRCHVRILRPIWPKTMKTRDQELKRLADLLGEEHDLSVLEERLRREARAPADRRAKQLLFDAIEHARRDLREAIDPLAGLLYAEEPDEFVHRVEVYWREWREGGDG